MRSTSTRGGDWTRVESGREDGAVEDDDEDTDVDADVLTPFNRFSYLPGIELAGECLALVLVLVVVAPAMSRGCGVGVGDACRGCGLGVEVV